MGILDILGGGAGGLGSMGSSLGSIISSMAGQATSAASDFTRKAPGGMGGLLGAGALGAVLGNLGSSDLLKNVGLLGAGAVAWNFYKKWAQEKQQEQAPQQGYQQPYQAGGATAGGFPEALSEPAHAATMAPAMRLDPTSELIMRSMIYAARADGNIDDTERQRMQAILQGMMPGQDASGIMRQISSETIDPAKIASAVQSPEQADDIYRLSCAVIDIDHFMERGYLDTLAKALNISPSQQGQLEAEADQARKSLEAAL